MNPPPPDRRRVLYGAGGLVAAAALAPGLARATAADRAVLSGPRIELTIDHAMLRIDGRESHAVAVNGAVPGPLIRLREGQTARIAVTNRLAEDTSIHWHGLLVPFQMDGVPGLSFPGVAPGETFVYEFPVKQAGTYWYHSHSGLQEQMGLYGPIVIDPAGADPVAYDREHVVVLSDHSRLHPHEILRRLKAQPGYFNRRRQTLAGLLAGRDQTLSDRAEWARMRMDPTDILDVTGEAYAYLINGQGPADSWSGLFTPGERVRLRIVNAGAMTIFNLRIPGLGLTVVQADGQDLRPVAVAELQIAPAETFDVIVTPTRDSAFTLVAEAADGSGMARGVLAPRAGMTAAVPPLRPRPLLGMRDMGMDMQMSHGAMGTMQPGGSMAMRDPKNAPGVPLGPGVQMIAPMPADRLADPPQGLAEAGHRVLRYSDLRALRPNPDPRPPSRSLEIHLTGNMERFMWGFDGKSYSHLSQPIAFRRDERVRITLVNDSMMAHPIHLHGHFFELITGEPGHHPRKHTVNVQPGGKVSFDLTADAPGDWAFHCHMLFHMHAGMFNVVTVRPLDGAA